MKFPWDKLAMFDEFTCTCSVDHPRDGALTFARTERHLKKLSNFMGTIGICIPLEIHVPLELCRSGTFWHPSEFFEYEFIKFHNWINRDRSPEKDIIAEGLKKDPDVPWMIGEGIHVGVGPGGVKEHMKHMGNVVIEENVFVGALTLIQRGTFDSTIIHDGVKLDSNCVIGHNSEIGENSVLSHAILGGSVKIGKNCWIGMGAIIKNGVSICENVVVGQGTNVVKDITEPGIYAGNPAKYMKPVKEEWNF